MTLRLILMRHAKSSWDHPASSDHSRPLNERGRKAALLIGEWLVKQGRVPDLVLASDAARTVETWERMRSAFADKPNLVLDDGLYLAPSRKMLQVLQTHTPQTVLMIGHNPGIADLAEILVQDAPDHPKFEHYPTGATTVIEFSVAGWSDVEAGKGTIVDFIVPKDL